LTRVRAAVVVTGTELVRGDRTDLNGPFLARELHERGVEAARVTIVGDRPEELQAALEEGLRADLLVVSGGLGPTHDDRTVELLARAAGRELRVDPDLEAEIEGVSRRTAERLKRPYGDFAPGVTKQASLPAGALSLGLAGTAPGVVIDTGSCVAVALPGPPNELRRLWAMAVESEPVRGVLARAQPPRRRVLRFYGVSESAVARVLDDAGGEQGGVEATVCARDFEIHVDLVGEGEKLASALRRELAEYLFSEDERPVAEIVLEECRARGLTLATAESCTGGLVSELITAIPGSSDVFVGGVVAYANEVKVEQLGVPAALIAEHGAVSAEVARAMAEGARRQLGVDVAVADTCIAGPGGGTPEKPVGTVYVDARAPDGGRGLHLALPGDRGIVRRRAAVASLHLVRQILGTER
jgi:competence/damage-inducible protein CinA-like protein